MRIATSGLHLSRRSTLMRKVGDIVMKPIFIT
jgi:hypothetical protein